MSQTVLNDRLTGCTEVKLLPHTHLCSLQLFEHKAFNGLVDLFIKLLLLMIFKTCWKSVIMIIQNDVIFETTLNSRFPRTIRDDVVLLQSFFIQTLYLNKGGKSERLNYTLREFQMNRKVIKTPKNMMKAGTCHTDKQLLCKSKFAKSTLAADENGKLNHFQIKGILSSEVMNFFGALWLV